MLIPEDGHSVKPPTVGDTARKNKQATVLTSIGVTKVDVTRCGN